MERLLIECVPNFSEGRDERIVDAIVEAAGSVDGEAVLHVDRGEAANRTVVTFAGSPEAVVEAAFRAVKKAGELIDMSRHHGEHPRIGATDVLPLVPVSGVTLEECVVMARQLAHRIAEELMIPCYLYEAAALVPEHKNLAVCRAGEYEALAEKLVTPGKAPDVGARPMDARIAKTGCTVVGARDFLIAVNFNLNTKDAKLANDIARRVREKGHGGKPGTLRCVKALGWYIEEYGIAQVSMNICNMHVTPLHVAYDEVCRQARLFGAEVTGTEIIGLVPQEALTQASPDGSIDAAIRRLGLSDLRPFNPQEKIIENVIGKLL